MSTFAPPFERRCLCGSSDKEGLKKKDLKFLNIFLEIKKRLLLLHPQSNERREIETRDIGLKRREV